MAAFKSLRDISNSFEHELRRISRELFSTKVSEPFEDVVAKKIQDLSLFYSKLRLLQAKPLAVTPQVTECNKSEHTITEYGDTVMWKIIEHQVVKSLTQTHTIKKLITTPNNSLDPELVERKEKIVDQLTKFRQQESQLRHLEAVLKEKEEELKESQEKWHNVLCRLKESRKLPQVEENSSGPLYKKLKVLIDKMELMRWLISKLVTSRTGEYDWIADPHRRFKALALARQKHTIQNYTES
ncbi:unnamed protein product [Danaus chrysippus]|uniref:(African queen) hypothetical protein n=1 Tax=Danaus chrysippus TaxID=151541 RepID=A0A8J2W8B0_9NEOP|nr:unnamed protein product [Danaus chrysippus]